MAIEPPFMFTLLSSKLSSFRMAQLCEPNASFISNKSIVSKDQLAFLSALRMHSIGATPISIGSQPCCAHETIRHSGFRFLFTASFKLHICIIAAPSFMPDALPAVIVPFSETKQGFNFFNPSRVVSKRGNSSSAMIFTSFLIVIFMGTIFRYLIKPCFD